MDELIDLVNADGQVVQTVPRNDTKRWPGRFMRIVIVVIFNQFGHVAVHARSKQKRIDPGYIDHVCGAMRSGETWEEAGLRETYQELGIVPYKLRLVDEGVNQYGHYRTLLTGSTNALLPIGHNPREVAWSAWWCVEDLQRALDEQSHQFVKGFFEDLRLARAVA